MDCRCRGCPKRPPTNSKKTSQKDEIATFCHDLESCCSDVPGTEQTFSCERNQAFCDEKPPTDNRKGNLKPLREPLAFRECMQHALSGLSTPQRKSSEVSETRLWDSRCRARSNAISPNNVQARQKERQCCDLSSVPGRQRSVRTPKHWHSPRSRREEGRPARHPTPDAAAVPQ